MGTRSITIFKDTDGEEIAVLYRHFDGCPSGHGAQLKELLAGRKIINGIFTNAAVKNQSFNGIGDLVVRFIVGLKTRLHENALITAEILKGMPGHRLEPSPSSQETPGGIYLYPAGARDIGEEYTYTISLTNGTYGETKIKLKVEGHDRVLFDGLVDNFDPERAMATLYSGDGVHDEG